MGQSQCNEIRAVAALNHPYAFVAWPAGLASRGCQHSVTRGRGQPQLRQHARAEKPAVPAGAEQPPVLSDLRGRCLPDLCKSYGYTAPPGRGCATPARLNSGVHRPVATSATANVPYRAKNRRFFESWPVVLTRA